MPPDFEILNDLVFVLVMFYIMKLGIMVQHKNLYLKRLIFEGHTMSSEDKKNNIRI